MATFNFAEAVKTVDDDVDCAKIALKKGLRFTFDGNSWKLDSLGEGHKPFIEMGVLAGFKACDNGKSFSDSDYDREFVELIALTSLFAVHKSFEKLDDTWIDHSKSSNLTFLSFFDLIRQNFKENDFWLEFWFSSCYERDDFVPEEEEQQTHICKKYTEGIVTCFETKKRKRDDDDEDNKEDK